MAHSGGLGTLDCGYLNGYEGTSSASLETDRGVDFGGFVDDDIERKHFGAYYTPSSIALALTEWAIRSPADRVLEPSFGDGVFVKAAARHLQGLGATGERPQVFGADIDPVAIAKMQTGQARLGVGVELRQADFLAIEPSSSWSKFDAAIGNPPYVRHHRIEKGTIADFRRQHVGLTGGADLWCTFLMHTLAFLQRGGRLAFILPASFGFAHYAQLVREYLHTRFETTVAIRLAFNTFAGSGTDERGVVVVCTGYDEGPSSGWRDQIAWTPHELRQQLASLRGEDSKWHAKRKDFSTSGIQTRRLGELAQIGIGFVTGANRTFIINEATRVRFDLPADTLVPVVSRTAQTPGITFSKLDHGAAVKTNRNVWLFAPVGLGERHGPVRRYLATVSRDVRRNTLWFRKRPAWYRPVIGQKPDAVFTYMNHLGPRLILLDGADAASNTFHVVTFRRAVGDPKPSQIALAMLTSYAQLSAERVGRAYGGGVLKLEPSEARQIEMPAPNEAVHDVIGAVRRADSLLKAGDAEAACALADEVLLKPLLGTRYIDVRKHLLDELAEARRFRLQRNSGGAETQR